MASCSLCTLLKWNCHSFWCEEATAVVQKVQIYSVHPCFSEVTLAENLKSSYSAMDLSTPCAGWAHMLLIKNESIPRNPEVRFANVKVKQMDAALKKTEKSWFILYYLSWKKPRLLLSFTTNWYRRKYFSLPCRNCLSSIGVERNPILDALEQLMTEKTNCASVFWFRH